MDFPIDIGSYVNLKLNGKGKLSESELETLSKNIELVRDAVIATTAFARAKGLGGHTGGPYDIVPETLSFVPELLIVVYHISQFVHSGLGLAIVGEGIVGLLEFPTVFSNVISYARIGAIGLSDYGLAFTVNYISLKMLVPMGPVGIIAAIFIMLIGHLTVFTLGIIGTGINSLRLQYVEFFTKFVQGGGTLYDPFGYDRKYTKENEVQP